MLPMGANAQMPEPTLAEKLKYGMSQFFSPENENRNLGLASALLSQSGWAPVGQAPTFGQALGQSLGGYQRGAALDKQNADEDQLKELAKQMGFEGLPSSVVPGLVSKMLEAKINPQQTDFQRKLAALEGAGVKPNSPEWLQAMGAYVAPENGPAETWGSPVDEMDENGNPIRVIYSNRRNRSVVPGARPHIRATTGMPTEDERKASGWYQQATNAYKNMEGVLATNPTADEPGVIESLSPEIIANQTRSPARQQYVQAASSFSEAVLRAATGAGVNKDEAAQKVRELTPQLGDSPEVRKQKRASMLVYLDSLKDRAGRAIGGKAASAGPVQIESDADYDELPSGAEFIDPDGVKRRKP